MRNSVFIDYFTYILMKILGWIASLLSPRFRGYLGMLIGNLLFFCQVIEKIALHNLKIAFPDKSIDGSKILLANLIKICRLYLSRPPQLSFSMKMI